MSNQSHGTDNEKTFDAHLKAENQHDLPSTLATLHKDCIYEDMARGQTLKGHDGAAKYYQTWWNAFDLTTSSERRYVTDEGFIVIEQRCTGLHNGDFYGIPATGNAVDFKMVTFVSFKDNLMAGERSYYDVGTILSQIGAKEFPS